MFEMATGQPPFGGATAFGASDSTMSRAECFADCTEQTAFRVQ
jgi:hypothetical protein